MNKLLSSNFGRLKKNKAFWIGTIFMLAAGVVVPVMRYITMQSYIARGDEFPLDRLEDDFFIYAVLISIVLSIVCSLFVSTEYSNGTMRNKVIVGHSRASIYLANFITSMAVGLILCVSFIITYLCVGIPLFGFFETDSQTILSLMLCVFIMTIALSAIYTLIAMLNQNKAVVAVICLLSAFILLFAGAHIHKQLSEPEVYPHYSSDANGELIVIDEIPNPNAITGTTREVYQFLYDFLPSGQAMQCYKLEAEHPVRIVIYSLIITVLTTGCGIFFFRRKNLK